MKITYSRHKKAKISYKYRSGRPPLGLGLAGGPAHRLIQMGLVSTLSTPPTPRAPEGPGDKPPCLRPLCQTAALPLEANRQDRDDEPETAMTAAVFGQGGPWTEADYLALGETRGSRRTLRREPAPDRCPVPSSTKQHLGLAGAALGRPERGTRPARMAPVGTYSGATQRSRREIRPESLLPGR